MPGRRLNIRANLTEISGRTPRIRREEPKSRAGYRQVPIVGALAVLLEGPPRRTRPDRRQRRVHQPGSAPGWAGATSAPTPGRRPAEPPPGRSWPSTTCGTPPPACSSHTPAPRSPSCSSCSAQISDRAHRRRVRPPRARSARGAARDLRRRGHRCTDAARRPGHRGGGPARRAPAAAGLVGLPSVLVPREGVNGRSGRLHGLSAPAHHRGSRGSG